MWISTTGERSPEVTLALNNLGDLLRELGRPAEARDMHQRSLDLATDIYGPDHYRVASSLAGLGEDFLELGNLQAASSHLTRAVAISEDQQVGDRLIAGRRFALARCLWESRADRERARTMAREALATYRGLPDGVVPKTDLERLERWVAEHP